MKVSGVVITYNEAQHIESCIRALQQVTDEIIVVDSFSGDNTPEICMNLGVKFFTHRYEGQVEQKNYALTLTSYEIVLSVDGDEVLSDKLINSINIEKSQGFPCEGYELNRLTNYAGHWIKHGGWYPDWKLRLWHKSKGSWQGQNPHDRVILYEDVKSKRLKGDILHYAFESVREHQSRMENYATIGAQSMFSSGKKANRALLLLSPAWKFVRDYLVKRGFLDGKYGFVIARLSAKSKYLKYKKLLALQQENR
ncbi:MAG: glycosyl transferase [Rickettsiales bacterium]|nr:glycosyl transferase [Rickettsiales bacterium]